MYKFIKTLLFISCIALLVSCEKDSSTEASGVKDKLLVGISVVDAQMNGSMFLGTIEDLSVTSHSNDLSFEEDRRAFLFIFGENVFALNYDENKITKYTRNNDGGLSKIKELFLGESSMPSGMELINETKAYISFAGTGKIGIINPKDMTKTGEIDLVDYAVGENDNNPEPCNIKMVENKVFVALYQNSTANYLHHIGAYMLVLDPETDMIEKMVENTSHNTSGTGGHQGSQDALFVDENGDLYIYNHGSWGFAPGHKNGFLRIKKGETDFDPDYFFDMTDYFVPGIPGNNMDFIYQFDYFKNGIVYASGNVPSLVSSPPDYINDMSFKTVEIDLINKNIEATALPYGNGNSASICTYGDIIFAGFTTKTGQGFYTYNPETKECSNGPAIKTEGDPSKIAVFE